jgi:hypothetical protein
VNQQSNIPLAVITVIAMIIIAEAAIKKERSLAAALARALGHP